MTRSECKSLSVKCEKGKEWGRGLGQGQLAAGQMLRRCLQYFNLLPGRRMLSSSQAVEVQVGTARRSRKPVVELGGVRQRRQDEALLYLSETRFPVHHCEEQCDSSYRNNIA